jgi:origin recognition complex subunit 3
MEYEKAYVFQPEEVRPAKRRRTEPHGLQISWQTRRAAYQNAWQEQQDRIDVSAYAWTLSRHMIDFSQVTLSEVNSSTVADVASYLDEATTGDRSGRIPTGIILTGPSTASTASIIKQLAQQKESSRKRRSFASLASGSGPNLKALLKALIQKATSRFVEDDEELDEVQGGKRKGAKLLNYDLQLLADHVEEHQTEQVVVSFEDTEAFDSDLLSELIELLGSWQDRIPFACLFSIATSVDFLQQRLSRQAIKCLDGRLFDVAPAGETLEQVFDALTQEESTVWLGSALASMILERQGDYIQGTDGFVGSVRYAYMSHYYANALSLFLTPGLALKDVPSDHFEAARNLVSFRAWAQAQLDDEQPRKVRDVLDSDSKLFALITGELEKGKQHMQDMIFAIVLVRLLQGKLPNASVSTKSSLYLQAFAGKLAGSALIRSLLLTIRRQPSDAVIHLVEAVAGLSGSHERLAECANMAKELKKLVKQQSDSAKPLRSEDDVKNATLRTTVVAQMVELSKQKSALSKEDAAYTDLLRRFSKVLETFFTATLVNPKDLPFHEIFLYDLRSPYREVFMPRPHHAIERALAAPHDYLDCECCAPKKGESEEATLAATQPATAVLYQLYLESGNLLNTSDLWQAFHAVMGDEAEEEKTMALFQRALADLKTLGMVKATRKRVDHVAKVAWRGL